MEKAESRSSASMLQPPLNESVADTAAVHVVSGLEKGCDP